MHKPDIYYIGFYKGLIIGLGIAVAIHFLTGCESFQNNHYEPQTIYNHEEEQDKDCLNRYGGQVGYCGKVYIREVK